MKNKSDRIQIAIQKSGRLHDASFSLLKTCGIHVARFQDKLFCQSDDFALDVLLLRDDDIPQFVLDGVCDFGIVGTNVLTEQSLQCGLDAQASIAQALHFSRCRLSIAAPQDFVYQSPKSLNGLRIATTYPYLLADFLKQHGVDATVVKLTGSVEIACGLGIADLICDLVSTGATLSANHLQEVALVFESQAVLMQSPKALSPAKQHTAQILLNRIQGAFLANGSKYIMLHAPKSTLAAIFNLLPGAECPTVMPLAGSSEKMVVHALCKEAVFWETMEALKSAGASSILVLPVEKMMI